MADRGCGAAHADAKLRCLHADVTLAEAVLASELRRARSAAARGDETWRARLADYEHGNMLIVALTASAIIDGGSVQPAPAPCCYGHEAVWIARASTQRELTDHMCSLARRAFASAARGLRDRGIKLAASDEQIAVEVTIDPGVRARLCAPRESDDDDDAGLRTADAAGGAT